MLDLIWLESVSEGGLSKHLNKIIGNVLIHSSMQFYK